MVNMLKALRDWVDARLPIVRAWNTHMGQYYAPKNFNFWYFFGVLSLVVLVNQLLTGIWLTMSYVPNADGALASVEYIMRDVDYGWLLRYLHSTGSSAFFVVVYLHMYRALLYGSYQKPRELIWILGMLIFVVLMAEAFFGYVLPWGQMSYCGAQVIISLVGAIPIVGEDLETWVRGDYLISGITLNRFFALHVVALPIILLALVVLHLLALHEVGSNNPDGVEIKAHKNAQGVPSDGIPFHPYYTVHDIQAVAVFLFVFCTVVFFFPEMGGLFLEPPNFEEANSLKTPEHIAPVWYFTPYYSILRAIPDTFWGFVAFAAAVAIPFVLPWLDRSPVRSWRYKGNLTKVMLVLFVSAFLILGVLGIKAPTPARTLLAQVVHDDLLCLLCADAVLDRRREDPAGSRADHHERRPLHLGRAGRNPAGRRADAGAAHGGGRGGHRGQAGQHGAGPARQGLPASRGGHLHELLHGLSFPAVLALREGGRRPRHSSRPDVAAHGV